MSTQTRNLREEIQEKLHNNVMQTALSRFAEQYPEARRKAYANVDDIDALRDDLRDMKRQTVDNIEQVASEFETSVKERGGQVYRAKDGEDLKQHLLQICRENNVQRIVKSKSMATEEIHLNKYLQQHDLHVRETDLGEWMLSVAGQTPSHMVMPAIHLDRKQCAKFFTQALNEEIPSDIPFMIQTARRVLREEFLQADMGISGANFGIAENGAIGLVTNEGNARIVTTLPRIHVVIMGYEKLIPKIEDAAKILRLLPRNGTCQRMTSYMTMIDGPTPVIYKKEDAWVEEDRKLYIILLDNGRLKAAQDPKLKEIYQCVRCASCLNVCPIWTLVGGHVYGHIYSGGIGAILTGLLNSMDDFSKFSDLCIGCRKCESICPGKIPIRLLADPARHHRGDFHVQFVPLHQEHGYHQRNAHFRKHRPPYPRTAHRLGLWRLPRRHGRLRHRHRHPGEHAGRHRHKSAAGSHGMPHRQFRADCLWLHRHPHRDARTDHRHRAFRTRQICLSAARSAESALPLSHRHGHWAIHPRLERGIPAHLHRRHQLSRSRNTRLLFHGARACRRRGFDLHHDRHRPLCENLKHRGSGLPHGYTKSLRFFPQRLAGLPALHPDLHLFARYF